MRAVHAYSGPAVRSAIYLIAWTVMRPGVVAGARWADIDFARREWHVEGKHMKTRHDHIVPLPTQAIEMLKAMYELTGQQEYVFPAMKHSSTPHLHRDTLSKAMRSMGFKGIHSPHGFRAMLRTLARERLGVERDVLEAQLAHAKGSDVEAAYDRTTFGEERRQVMQQWADYLDRLRTDSSEDPPAT